MIENIKGTVSEKEWREEEEIENSGKDEYGHIHNVPGTGNEEIKGKESILIILQRKKSSIINMQDLYCFYALDMTLAHHSENFQNILIISCCDKY